MSDSTLSLTLKARDLLGLNQRTLGERFGLSRRTIQRWDSRQSSPQAFHLHAIAVAVHPHDPDLAARIAARGGATLEQLGIHPEPAPVAPPPPPLAPPPVVPVTPPGPTPEMIRHLTDVVVCAAADTMATPPATVRPVLVSALRKAVEFGLTAEDILTVLAPPPSPAPPKGKGSKAARGGSR